MDSSFQNSRPNLRMSLPNGNPANSSSAHSVVSPRSTSFNSSQLLAQRKIFAESQMGRSSFQKLLEPRASQSPGIAPYRVVLGNVKDKVLLIHWMRLPTF